MRTLIYISYYLLLAMNFIAIFLVGLAEWQVKGEINGTVVVWAVLTGICFVLIAIGLNKYFDLIDEYEEKH